MTVVFRRDEQLLGFKFSMRILSPSVKKTKTNDNLGKAIIMPRVAVCESRRGWVRRGEENFTLHYCVCVANKVPSVIFSSHWMRVCSRKALRCVSAACSAVRQHPLGAFSEQSTLQLC